jgi:hypothetical protein
MPGRLASGCPIPVPKHSPSEDINMAQGLVVFPTLAAAVRAGFQIYDRTSDGGVIVRSRTPTGFALALVPKP